MEAFMSGLSAVWAQFLTVVKSFNFSSALDVLLVSFIIYSAVKLVRETRAGQLIKGIMIMLVLWVISSTSWLNLTMIRTILTYCFSFALIAVLIVFQPEIRRALEQMGRSEISKSWVFNWSRKQEEDQRVDNRRRCVNAVVDAAAIFQRQKTGALIVFEMKTKLGDIIDTGTVVGAIPSAPIICNIFFNKAPLHDGAMVIRESMVHAAGCILPLTKSDSVSIELGTRHRAAIGVSENSDAVVVVVSEETGQISIAVNGVLTRNYTRETLKSALEGFLLPPVQEKGVRIHKPPSARRDKKE